jgi:hypothetical protein
MCVLRCRARRRYAAASKTRRLSGAQDAMPSRCRRHANDAFDVRRRYVTMTPDACASAKRVGAIRVCYLPNVSHNQAYAVLKRVCCRALVFRCAARAQPRAMRDAMRAVCAR